MAPVFRDAGDVANTTLNPLATQYPKGTTESIAYQPVAMLDGFEESINLNGK